MNKLKELMNRIKTTAYQIVNGKMQQTQRNNLRAEIENTIYQDLMEMFESVYETKEGIYILIPNDEDGFIPVSINVKIPMVFNEEGETYYEDLAKEFEQATNEKKAKAIEKMNKQKENKAKVTKK